MRLWDRTSPMAHWVGSVTGNAVRLAMAVALWSRGRVVLRWVWSVVLCSSRVGCLGMMLSRSVSVGWPGGTSVWLEDDPLRRSVPEATRCSGGAWCILRFGVPGRSPVVAGRLRRVVSGGAIALVILEGSRQQVAALGSEVFEDLGRGRRFVVDGADLVGGQVFVVGGLEAEGDGGLVGRVDAELCSGGTPGEFLVRDLVIASVLDDVVEDLEEIEMAVSYFGLGVEAGASFGVEGLELLDKGLVLGGAVDGVLWHGLLRRHRGRSARGGRAQMLYNCASKAERMHVVSRNKIRIRRGQPSVDARAGGEAGATGSQTLDCDAIDGGRSGRVK